jgi:hypothetical protein
MIVDLRSPISNLRLGRRGFATRGRLALQSQIANRKLKISGYSFPEVMFAVVVLGIGFIMIAAIFPVAIAQSKSTADESTAAAMARGAANTLSRLAYNTQTVPPPPVLMWPTGAAGGGPSFPGIVRPFDLTTEAWTQTRGTLISFEDPRYAYVPLYRRDGDPVLPLLPNPRGLVDNKAQVYIFVVQCRSTARPATGGVSIGSTPANVPARTALAFDQYDVGLDIAIGNPSIPGVSAPTPLTNPNNLWPHQIIITALTNNAAGPDTMTVTQAPNTTAGPNENTPDAIAEGAYVVVATTGRIYHIGAPVAGAPATPAGNPTQWELQPGGDITITTNAEDITTNTPAWVVGRERLPGTAAAPGGFIGPAQDVAIYTTFIPVTP